MIQSCWKSQAGFGAAALIAEGGRLAAGGCRVKAIVIREFGDPEVLRWVEIMVSTDIPD
jgi:hypothetical protein